MKSSRTRPLTHLSAVAHTSSDITNRARSTPVDSTRLGDSLHAALGYPYISQAASACVTHLYDKPRARSTNAGHNVLVNSNCYALIASLHR
jgi:hypothetical protein